jgi:hypothetical protein
MSENGSYRTLLIDVPLWDQAGWRGVTYSYQEGRLPAMGFAFENRDAGRQVLRELRQATGPIDTFELIRIAIIEGDIPGEQPGYTVLITPNLDGIVAKARAEGEQPPTDSVIMSGLFRRIGPTTASRSVGQFKDAFAKYHRYSLVGASLSDRSIDFDVAIEKTLIVFKHVSQIGENDVDQMIFARETRQRRH